MERGKRRERNRLEEKKTKERPNRDWEGEREEKRERKKPKNEEGLVEGEEKR